MIENPRFWTALIFYFTATALTAGIRSYHRKRTPILPYIYLVLALLSSIGFWLYAGTVEYRFIEIFNLVNLFCFATGVFTGFAVYLLPLFFLFPLLFSIVYKAPLAPLVSPDESVLGELFFYPSNEGDIRVGWITDETETFISLKGEKAGILFVRKSPASRYFFLKESLSPMAVLSESHPVADLAGADPDWYYPLHSGKENDSSLYKSSFPAVKYHAAGFFTSYTYSVKNGHISIRRN